MTIPIEIFWIIWWLVKDFGANGDLGFMAALFPSTSSY